MAEDNNGEWWDNYSKYLKSAQWKELSAKVLERDKRVCQNCFRHNATQAHHVSYKNYNKLGYSLAFDCVAICDDCHKLAHPHLRDGFDAAKEPVVSDLEEMARSQDGGFLENLLKHFPLKNCDFRYLLMDMIRDGYSIKTRYKDGFVQLLPSAKSCKPLMHWLHTSTANWRGFICDAVFIRSPVELKPNEYRVLSISDLNKEFKCATRRDPGGYHKMYGIDPSRAARFKDRQFVIEEVATEQEDECNRSSMPEWLTYNENMQPYDDLNEEDECSQSSMPEWLTFGEPTDNNGNHRRLPPPSLIWFDFDEKEDKRKS